MAVRKKAKSKLSFDEWKAKCSAHLYEELTLHDLLAPDDPYDMKESMKAAYDKGTSPKDFIEDAFGEDIARQEYDTMQAVEAEQYDSDE